MPRERRGEDYRLSRSLGSLHLHPCNAFSKDGTVAPRRWDLSGRSTIALSVALLLLAAGLFWGTAVSTSWARIEALETIEPYGFAVHQQLLYNFSTGGHFLQTVHMGYDDAWTWSGHRSATLVFNGLLYGLDRSALWLSKLQILEMMLGVVPAALLGRLALRSAWGLLLGGLLYLFSPAVMALSLQDYQDLALATPALLFALWACRSRSLAVVALGCLVGCLPREECVPLVVACALVTPAPTRRVWLQRIGISVGVAVIYTTFLTVVFPMAETQHDMPLQNALSGLLQWPPRIFLDGLPYFKSFYSLLWAPIGLLGLLAPHLLLPGAALVLLHMTVPWGHGVDRSWGGHVHHMGPILPFFLAAAIDGAGRLLRWIQDPGATRLPARARRLLQRGKANQWLAVGCALGLASMGFQWDRAWARHYRLVLKPTPTQPTYRHPAWALVEQLPESAVPIVSRQVSLAVSNRTRSFTFDDSLFEKVPGQGLAAGTHLLVDNRWEAVRAWALAMEGAEVLATSGSFELITWDPGASDAQLPEAAPPPPAFMAPQEGSPRVRTDIPGVPPRQAPPAPPKPAWEPEMHTGPGERPQGGPAPR